MREGRGGEKEEGSKKRPPRVASHRGAAMALRTERRVKRIACGAGNRAGGPFAEIMITVMTTAASMAARL